MVFIDAGEQACSNVWPAGGRPPCAGAGCALKLPWPIDQVYRYPTEQIQSFNVGFAPDPARENDKTVLWTVSHTKEENFLVANREMAVSEATNPTTPAANGRRRSAC